MDLFSVPGSDSKAALRALKAVALANGRYEDSERAMMRAAADAYRVQTDVDALEPIAPEDLAAAVPDPTDRLRVLQACMLMSLADAEASPAEIAMLDQFRAALGVDEPRMSVLRSLAVDHKTMARLHLIRNSEGGRSQAKGAKLTEVLRAFGVLPTDPTVVQKFKALGSLPEGTLGREYVRYMERNKFPWPGEKSGLAEPVVHHDLTHVPTGYDTDPLGEIEIGSFTAGMKSTDPFFFLIGTMLEFHVGLAVRPGQPAFPGNYDASRALHAHQRGARCKLDLTDYWDFWKVIDHPVTELQKTYGIA